jgi:hypothetical protein
MTRSRHYSIAGARPMDEVEKASGEISRLIRIRDTGVP